MVTQGASNGLCATIMPIQAGFGNDNTVGPLHEYRTLGGCAPIVTTGPASGARIIARIRAHTNAVYRGDRSGRLRAMRRSQLRSPLARAVVPVLGGLAFFVALGLFLWGIASYISRNSDSTANRFAPTVFDVGRTSAIAKSIAADGPLIFPDLLQSNGRRTIVLDHSGSDPQTNWAIYMAYPADRNVSCKVTQIQRTRQFTDCEGRTILVAKLALPPPGVNPVVSPDGLLSLDLLPTSAEPAGTTATS